MKHAEIELSPMLLFVGDNNSGKSYLLSLIWAIYAISSDALFSTANMYVFYNHFECNAYREIENIFVKILDRLEEGDFASINIETIIVQLQQVINQLLESTKENLIKKIFNSDCVNIERLSLTMPKDISGTIKLMREQSNLVISYRGRSYSFPNVWQDDDAEKLKDRKKKVVLVYIPDLILILLGANANRLKRDDMVYLPAARTGFMLTKDIINKFARRNTYDLEVITDGQEQVQPFSRPIIDFLDVVNDLSEEQNGSEINKEIASFIRNKMIQGNIEIGALGGRELTYLPDGQNTRYPFRATSAVVTELSPLLLLLEHQKQLLGLFYEEPELCLHPALQKRMGQVLIKLVNAGIKVTATTHSDIILQHVNNMIRLKQTEESAKDFDYDETDFIVKDRIRVYQFSNCADGTTEVKELPCGEYGFVIPTFNDALDDMMDEAIRIQK